MASVMFSINKDLLKALQAPLPVEDGLYAVFDHMNTLDVMLVCLYYFLSLVQTHPAFLIEHTQCCWF